MIFAAMLPKVKIFLRPAKLRPTTVALLVRLITAFCHHTERMSAHAAADALRGQRRHRAAIARFLARMPWSRNGAVLTAVADVVLQAEARRDGPWTFILDQTYCGQQGLQTENTFSRANYRPRAKRGQRKNKKRARRCCHGFVMGLLLTPSGLRIPCVRTTANRCPCRRC